MQRPRAPPRACAGAPASDRRSNRAGPPSPFCDEPIVERGLRAEVTIPDGRWRVTNHAGGRRSRPSWLDRCGTLEGVIPSRHDPAVLPPQLSLPASLASIESLRPSCAEHRRPSSLRPCFK
jgi:hypothetical protein